MRQMKKWNKLTFIVLNGALGIGFSIWLLSIAVDIEVLPGRMHMALTLITLIALLAVGAAICAFRLRSEQSKQAYAKSLYKSAKKSGLMQLLVALFSGLVVVAFTLFLNNTNNPGHHLVAMQLCVFGLSVATVMLLNQSWMRFTYAHYFNTKNDVPAS